MLTHYDCLAHIPWRSTHGALMTWKFALFAYNRELLDLISSLIRAKYLSSLVIPCLFSIFTLVKQFSSPSCHFNSLLFRYSPLYPILKHSRSIFLFSFQKPSFISIQNHRKYYKLFIQIFTLIYYSGSSKLWLFKQCSQSWFSYDILLVFHGRIASPKVM
jgi:hypothetical protein